MNELDWRRQLRDLRQPQPPRRDLWDAIAGALDDDATAQAAGAGMTLGKRPEPSRRRWLAAACIVAAALLFGGTSWRLLHAPAPTMVALAPGGAPLWKPADPRLSAAAIELSTARMELRQALRQAPDSAALQRLLKRTEQQQSQLHQLAHDAG